jgi:hypothetical protein
MQRETLTATAVVLLAVVLVASAGPAAGYDAGSPDGALARTAPPVPGIDDGATVDVTVTMDGEPTDAQIIARNASSGDVAAVEYTNVTNPGTATLQLDPGTYEIEFDAGGGIVSEREYRAVTVDSEGASVSADVTRLYEPNDRNWYGADRHVHTEFSADSSAPLEEVVAAQLGAQLDVLTITDHNDVRGHSPFKDLAQQHGMPYTLSEELTTDIDGDDPVQRVRNRESADWGHFNPYPLPEGRLVDWTGDPVDFFGDSRAAGAEVIQANHPMRDGNYFTPSRLNRSTWNDSFDAAEVYNRGYDSDEAGTIQQMFEFWNQGYRYTATASTDDHSTESLGNEYGTPRTYVYMDEPPSGNSSRHADAIDGQHAFVSYGPLVYFETEGGAIPGDNVSSASGEITLTADIENVGELANATLVRNGTPVKNFSLSETTDTIEYETDVDGTKWYVLRVRDEAGAQGTRAMTNPIYVSNSDEGVIE